MNVTIFGTGYVGLVTGACLAEVGHHVMCVDLDEAKIERLKQGEIPIFEPGLEPIVKNNYANGRLQFTTDPKTGVDFATLQFIAVGTPADEDGSADLQYVLAVAEGVATHMQNEKVIVDKSTVPVGTADKVSAKVKETLEKRGVDIPYSVVSNPEFLKEGAAVNDFLKPDRIVVGTENENAAKAMKELYAPFNRNHERTIFMDVRSAELTKYAANAMLATKISFMNELANMAELLGADIEKVRVGIGSDPRIGYHFIYPGCGYGGSCFPKDMKALVSIAKEISYDAPLLAAVDVVNQRQKHVLFTKLSEYFGGAENLKGKTIALWGLAFKPKTDDIREASSRELMESLWKAGAKVQAFDFEAMGEIKRVYGERDDLMLCKNKEACLEGADVLVICTEWQQFRAPDFDLIKEKLSQLAIFDGRNMYEPEVVQGYGFKYFAIGRADSLKI